MLHHDDVLQSHLILLGSLMQADRELREIENGRRYGPKLKEVGGYWPAQGRINDSLKEVYREIGIRVAEEHCGDVEGSWQDDAIQHVYNNHKRHCPGCQRDNWKVEGETAALAGIREDTVERRLSFGDSYQKPVTIVTGACTEPGCSHRWDVILPS